MVIVYYNTKSCYAHNKNIYLYRTKMRLDYGGHKNLLKTCFGRFFENIFKKFERKKNLNTKLLKIYKHRV